MKSMSKDGEVATKMDICFVCKKETHERKDTPIEKRSCYYDGPYPDLRGQMCRDCWALIFHGVTQ